MKLKISIEVPVKACQIPALAAAAMNSGMVVVPIGGVPDLELARLYLESHAEQDVFAVLCDRRCVKCGCTHTEPCDEGCEWVSQNLCSACV